MESIQKKLAQAMKLLTEVQQALTDKNRLQPVTNGEYVSVKIVPPSGGRFAWKHYVKLALESGELMGSPEVAEIVAKSNNELPSETFKRRTSQVLGEMFMMNQAGRYYDPSKAGFLYGKLEVFEKGADGRYSILKEN